MSRLRIFNSSTPAVSSVVSDAGEISAVLQGIGVRFERWPAGSSIDRDAGEEEVIAAYRSCVDQLMGEYGFQSVDVIAMTPEHPEKETLRARFLAEHTHSDFEVRFFVEGRGLFYIHVGDKVYGVLCEAGDLISVPADAKHWFDMGTAPDFKCIRLFTTPEGWVANYTGDPIAAAFPDIEHFCA